MGLKIKLKRIEKGIKQKDMATALEISPQYLRLIEAGKATNPSMSHLKIISLVPQWR